MEMFNCPLPSVSVNDRKHKFLVKVSVSENMIMPSLCRVRQVMFYIYAADLT